MTSKATLTPAWAETHLFGEMVTRYNGQPEFSIKSKPALNRLLYGFERETLVVIAARPSECKSAFALNIGYELSLEHKVLYMSFEMTKKEAMFRILCMGTQIPNNDFYDGKADMHKERIASFEEKFKSRKRNLIITEDRGRKWTDVMNIMEELGDDTPDIIIIDYIQLIKTAGATKETINQYIQDLRTLAINKKMCVIICSQIGRAGVAENKEPDGMTGCKETGGIEECADKLLTLSYKCKRLHSADRNDFKVIISKNKNGMTGYLNMRVIPEIYSFHEIETQTSKPRPRYESVVEGLNEGI